MRSRILASVALAALLSAPAYAQSSGSGGTTAPAQTESRSDSAAPAAGSAGTTSGASTTTTTGSGATTSGAKSADADKPAASGAVMTEQERDQVTADGLIGMDVRNPQDEKVGEIEDLVLDSDMKVVGIVVSAGGFLGLGQRNVALTREQVDIRAEGDRDRVAIVSMTKDQLKAAPEFKTLDRQQAEAEQERARQGTAAGTGASPTGSGATTPPPARNQ